MGPYSGGTMIRTSLSALAALSLSLLSSEPAAAASSWQDPVYTAPQEIRRYSAEQLDNLVSPVALYPDPLLAQVLVAATFPDQVEEAARWVRGNGTADIDEMPWDVSVRAIAHYPSVLNMMAERADWMATLGRAYAFQSSDVMNATQRMRALADSHGNLVSNEQQHVVRESNNYVIVPAQPQIIYVPVYDPFAVYSRPIFGAAFSSRYWSFGVGFPIGGWLNYDLDWGRHVVYYNGWNRSYFGYGGGWRGRSYPFVHITNVYVNPRYRDVYVNRYVDRRVINYRNVDRYPRVHGDVYFADVRDNGRSERARDIGRAVDNAQSGRDERARDVQRAIGSTDSRTAGARANDGRVERSASTRDAIQRATGGTGAVNATTAPETRRSEPTRRIGELPPVDRNTRADRVRGAIGDVGTSSPSAQTRTVPQSYPQSTPQRSPQPVERSVPQAVQRSAQPSSSSQPVRRSAQREVQTQAAPQVQRSAPQPQPSAPQVQRSAPPSGGRSDGGGSVQRSAPPQAQQAPPPSSGSGQGGSPTKVTRRPPG